MDELNSVLGGLAAVLADEESRSRAEIRQIQSDLLHVGAWLATTPGSPSMAELAEITGEHCRTLEKAIDRMVGAMPTLKGFILPGGHISAAWAHVARTVCRRAERRVVRLYEESIESGGQGQLRGVLTYLNRLSDYLFVLARYCNMHHGVHDIEWEKK
jgi:cob(I)alamin adenosyltransferase